MLAWLEVPVKSRYDVGTLVNVNLSLWLVSILLLPPLDTNNCNGPSAPSHGDQYFVS